MAKPYSHAKTAQLRKEISELLALGCENKEIEYKLHLSGDAVRNQIAKLRESYNIETTRRLVLFLAQAPGHWPKKRIPLQPQPTVVRYQ